MARAVQHSRDREDARRLERSARSTRPISPGASRTPARPRSPCTGARRRSRTPASPTGRSSRASRASLDSRVRLGRLRRAGQTSRARLAVGVERRARRPRRVAQSVDFRQAADVAAGGRGAGDHARGARPVPARLHAAAATERVGEDAGFRHIAPGQAPIPPRHRPRPRALGHQQASRAGLLVYEGSGQWVEAEGGDQLRAVDSRAAGAYPGVLLHARRSVVIRPRLPGFSSARSRRSAMRECATRDCTNNPECANASLNGASLGSSPIPSSHSASNAVAFASAKSTIGSYSQNLPRAPVVHDPRVHDRRRRARFPKQPRERLMQRMAM